MLDCWMLWIVASVAAQQLPLQGATSQKPYVYAPDTDCYGGVMHNDHQVPYDKHQTGKHSAFVTREPFKCREDEWCRVEQRINWRPFAVNYMTRGRCEKWRTVGQSCTVAHGLGMSNVGAFSGVHMTDSAGKLPQRPLFCKPGDSICTGDTILVLPATCVHKRPKHVCYTNQLDGWHKTHWDPDNVAEAPGRGMWCPSAQKSPVTREQLEYAARYFVSMNGENQIIDNIDDLESGRVETFARPKVVNFYGGGRKETWRLANEALESVWPFPICINSSQDAVHRKKQGCTSFPIAPISADHLAGHMGYIYLWTVFHLIAHNLPLVLTPKHLAAIDTLVILTQQFMSCVYCRANFEEIVNTVGLPSKTCSNGQQVAKWFWIAHNNANEHSRITHRVSDELECKLDAQFCQGWHKCKDDSLKPGFRCNGKGKRTVFENPDYTSPWFLSWQDAQSIWTLPTN